MKSTGIVRKLDNLGRVLIPVEVRRMMEIEDRDGLEIFFDND
jgi:transcriptional pleiotropic regulator of transition state genes